MDNSSKQDECEPGKECDLLKAPRMVQGMNGDLHRSI
jgi:hypothetical protein